MNVTTAPDRLKKVMRIALVGIKPGDQVMLKGYLRILLRLEADLEWVSANNQQIDLFMVNHDFRHSESVQKLINSKPNTATIFTARSETENGYLSHDLLVIPLKDLEPFSQWLFSEVPFLSGMQLTTPTSDKALVETAKDVSAAQPATAINSSASPTHIHLNTQHNNLHQPTQTLAANHNHTNSLQANRGELTNSISTSAMNDVAQTPSVNDDYFLGFAKTFSRIQQRQNEVLSISSPAGTLFAYINPKQQRIWELTEHISSNQPWVLTSVNDSVKKQLDVKNAKNMVEWLWDLSEKNGHKLETILDPQIKYQIESWVKPIHNAEQHDHLKIQCVLEARAVTIDEIVALSQCTLSQVKKTLIGLFIAGVFPASVYQQTIAKLSSRNNTADAQSQSQRQPILAPTVIQPIEVEKTTTDSHVAEPNISTAASESVPHQSKAQVQAQPQSKLDEILSRRAMAENSSSNTVSSVSSPANSSTWNSQQMQADKTSESTNSASPQSIAQSTAQQSAETPDGGNNGMMGFLGRLRRRLGL